MLGGIGDALDDIPFDIGSAVVVDDVAFRILVPDYYNILGEFVRHGVDVHFPAASPDLERFGTERCESGDQRWRLRIFVGWNRPVLDGFDVVLANVVGTVGDQSREFDELNDEMLDLLHSDRIQVDREQIALAGISGELLLEVLDSPDEPHGDIWFPLVDLIERGVVSIPSQYRADYERWNGLAQGNVAATLLVYLTPNYVPTVGTC